MMMTPMTIADSSPSFQFSSLPPELRIQIWREVLSEKPSPVFFTYKSGCWQSRFVTDADKDYDPPYFSGHVIDHHEKFLDPVEFEIPIFFVNCEARSMVRYWISQNNVEIRFRKRASQPVFLRRFEKWRDVLYVPADKYHDFCCEPFVRFSELKPIGQALTYANCEIPNIAIAEGSFRNCMVDFDEVILDFFFPSTLLIVLNARTDLSSENGDTNRQNKRSVGTRERALVWNLAHQKFNWDKGEYICNQDMYKRVEVAADENVVGAPIKDKVRRFEIRPTLAVRG